MAQIRVQSNVSNLKSWLMATRPKTLTTAIIPVIIATALASDRVIPSWEITLFSILCALFITIGTNLINDAMDFSNGKDNEHRIGPTRVTQNGLLSFKQVYIGGLAAYTLAALAGLPLIWYGGWPIALLLAFAIVSGYAYTGGPWPFGYHGLGELFVFPFYGLASVVAVYYLQTGRIIPETWLAGVQVGALATAVLALNNLRDYRGDSLTNKRTMAVRFGKTFARCEITVLILLPYILTVEWFQSGYPIAALLPCLTFPLAVQIVYKIWKTRLGPIYNRFFAQSALLHLTFGISLALGLIFETL